MDVLMVLIAIIGIAVSIANKKKAAEAQRSRKAAQTREAVGPKAASPQSAPTRTSPAKPSVAPSKFPTPGPPSKYPPATSKRQPAAAQKTQPSYGGTPKYTHAVMSTLEGGHTHTESSMTGEEACPPPMPAASQKPEARPTAEATGTLLDFQPNSVLQGVLYAEILGKPKALQRD